MVRRIVVVMLAGGLWIAQAQGSDYPTRGTLTGTVEQDGLQYRCTKEEPAILSCDFTQVSIRLARETLEWSVLKKRLMEDFEQTSSEERAKRAESMCRYSKQLESKLSDPSESPSQQGSQKEAKVKALAEFAPLAVQFCAKPSLENMIAMAKLSFDRETRTCEVTINNFSQRFKASSAGWSVISEPAGECGVVQLSKFEQDSEFFWQYTARKAVTNPQNETAFGMACSDFDEKPYTFTWEPVEKAIECDFIRY